MQHVSENAHEPSSQYSYERSLRRQVAALQERCQELEARGARGLEARGEDGSVSSQEQQHRTLLAENGILLEEIASMRRQLAELRSQHAPSGAHSLGSGGQRELGVEQDSQQQLTEEIERLRTQNSSLMGTSREVREVRHRNESLQASNSALEARVAELNSRIAELDAEQENSTFGHLRKTMKEFTLSTVMELEKKTTAAATRAAAAEEQLDELHKYMAQSTLTYQKEIVRLRKLVAKYAPEELQPRPDSSVLENS